MFKVYNRAEILPVPEIFTLETKWRQRREGRNIRSVQADCAVCARAGPDLGISAHGYNCFKTLRLLLRTISVSLGYCRAYHNICVKPDSGAPCLGRGPKAPPDVLESDFDSGSRTVLKYVASLGLNESEWFDTIRRFGAVLRTESTPIFGCRSETF